jgi:hypothetical protein
LAGLPKEKGSGEDEAGVTGTGNSQRSAALDMVLWDASRRGLPDDALDGFSLSFFHYALRHDDGRPAGGPQR